jgi:hypothetical protein
MWDIAFGGIEDKINHSDVDKSIVRAGTRTVRSGVANSFDDVRIDLAQKRNG